MYEHMRKLRKERKLRQWQLAEYLKCSQRTFSDYESGKSSGSLPEYDKYNSENCQLVIA